MNQAIDTTDRSRNHGAEPRRILELDGIRGLAILLVLIWHYVVCTNGGAWRGTQFLGLTLAGVDLFFVISGFLIGGILIDNHDAPGYFKAFYVRRACRVFPPYFLLILAYVFALNSGWLNNPGFAWLNDRPLPVWSYLAFLQSFFMAQADTLGPNWLGVTWSLAVEEQFYLLAPLVIRFIPLARVPILCVFCILAAPVMRLAFWFFLEGRLASYVLMPARMDALFLGVLVAWIARQPVVVAYLRKDFYFLRVTLGLGVLGSALLCFDPSPISVAMTYWGHTWLALTGALLVLALLAHPCGVLGLIFRNRGLRQLGAISYGVYLFHQMVLGLAHGLVMAKPPSMRTGAEAMVTAGALMVTLLLATCSYLLIERPLVRWGHKVPYRGDDPPQPSLQPREV